MIYLLFRFKHEVHRRHCHGDRCPRLLLTTSARSVITESALFKEAKDENLQSKKVTILSHRQLDVNCPRTIFFQTFLCIPQELKLNISYIKERKNEQIMRSICSVRWNICFRTFHWRCITWQWNCVLERSALKVAAKVNEHHDPNQSVSASKSNSMEVMFNGASLLWWNLFFVLCVFE